MFRPRFLLTRTAFAAAFVFVLLAAVTATSQTIDFESPTYSIGNINGQDGWSKTGSFDAAVASSGGRTGFGAQSFRISNAVTSGSFGDQTFSKSLLNEAGESTAVNDGMSGGVRQSRFDYQFSIASAVPGAQQPGLAMTISPDRGDGSRMSFLRFEDQADGIHAVFFDYVDVAPFGGANGDVNGCDAGDNFFSTDIATLDRSGIHRIRIVIDFNEGPRNDVVRIYINGELRKTGTSWEDYYRYCAEQNFNQNVRTVDSLLFRASGTAAPATSGAGFLFDNLVGVTTTPTTVTVSPASANNWLFYNDETDTPDTTLTALGTFIAGPGTPPYGTGSAQISVTGTQRRNLATYQFAGTVLSTITDFKYSTYNPSAGNGGSASRSAYVNFNVDFNGTDTWQRRILFLPGDNGTVIQNAWQEWDMINGGNARWRYSGATWPAGVGGGGESGSTAKTWNQILSQYPGVRFRVTDAHFGIRVGEPYADGYTENLDSVTFGTAAGTQIFNFEPSPIKVVDDDGFASITNCDDPAAVAHTTVGSAVTAANAGDTIRICPGTYAPASTVALNKAGLTLTAAEATKPVLQVSGTGYSFLVTAANVTLDNLEIQKTDAGVPSPAHNIIGVQADNFTAQNNLIYGPNPGTTWASNGIVSRAFEVSGGRSGIVIQNNTIHTLRQPGYLNSSSGSITNNVVYGTRGWVVDSGSAFWNFSGNSWGTAENEACDIALIASTVLANYSPLLALSTNNTNAFICSGGIGGQDGRTTAYVDASNTLGGSSLDPYTTIQAGINGALPGGTVNVAAGTYVEDININKTLTVVGAGAASTTISGAIGGDGATVRISANNVEISGFTITREGNNTTDWNNGGLNFGGVAISNLAVTGALIRDNIITGNRTGIDINNSGGHTVRNNVIENNRTGMLFRNQTDNMTVVENSISDNWTVGVLFIDASSGSNVPVQQALGSTFSNNNISGNWYGQIVDRQTGGALPAAGSNLKYFQGNWLGTVAPTIVNTNTTEPGYAGLIPVAFGGTATPPGGQPDIAGEASANFRYQPLLTSGTDTNVETTPGRGTFGFQGAPVVVTSPSADGWAFFTEIANGSGAFVGGPPTPPLGIGSANLTVDATGRQIIGTANYAGTRLDDITNLRYRSHQVSANPAVAPSLQFDMDYDTTDGNTAWQGRLVYEPYMSGTVQQNTWQTWDPLAGMWWSTSAPGNASCPQADPCTWAEVLAAFPNAGIRPPSLNGGVIFKAGGPVGSSLVSHVDGFEIGINTANTTFDFDAGRPTVTIDQAAGQGDPTSDAAIDFTATFSEAVTGFDASDVVIGGTAGPTTVQVTGGPTVYNVAVSGMTGSGTVTASIVDSAAVNGANSPTQASTSADNTVTYFTCNTVSIPTGITTLRNQQVSVPINVDDVTGRGAFTSDLTVTYNASVLSYVGIDTAGTIADGSTITVNSLNPGVLVISVFNGNADFTGSGTFLSLRFLANGAIGTTSAMNFSGFIFNNGVPCVNTSNGLVTVISSAVSGQVDYVNSPTPKVVPGTTLTGIGVSGPTVNAVTDAAGQYSLSGFGAGAYTVTPSKAGDVNGITSFDAGQVARHTVGLITLNSNQLLAADVSQDGTINSFDAGNIARFIVGNPSHASTGSWRFVPASRNYSSVETAQANQNYGGILLGDVDGSWTPPSPFAELAAEPEETPNDIRFVANDLRAAPGTTVTIPISVANFADKGIFDYQFEIAFDPNVLEARGDLASLVGTLSEGSSVTAYSPEPGIVRVAVYGVTPITADGTLVNLHLAVIGGKGSSTPIEIRLPVAGNGSLPVRVTNGSLAVESAAERSLMGTVETADGQAIGRARVTLTDANGNSRTTVSSSFGQFEFGDLEPSQTYVISVNAKGHTFTPLTFTVGRESLRIAIRAQQ